MSQTDGNLSNNHEITLRELFKILKKTFLPAVLSAIITFLVTFSLLYSIRHLTTEKSYSTTISFLNADTATVHQLNSIKSEIVSKAVVDANLNEVNSDYITSSLSINSVVPENELENSNFIPTSYKITLNPTEKIKLTNNESVSLIDQIARHYVNYFSKGSLPSLSYESSVNFDELNTEYLQIANRFINVVSEYLIKIESFTSANPTVKDYQDVCTKNTISTLLLRLDQILETLDETSAFIVLNKVETKTNGLQNYLTLSILSATALCDRYSLELNDAKEVFEKYSSLPKIENSETGFTTYVTYEDTIYRELWEGVKTASTKLALATEEKERMTGYKNALSDNVCTDADKELVCSELKNVEYKIKEFIGDYQSLSESFRNYQNLNSSIKISLPSHVEDSSIINDELIIILTASFTILAYTVATVKSHSKRR